MASTTPGVSLSARSQMPQGKPHSINEYVSVKKPPHLDRLTATTHQESTIEPVTIDVDDAPNGFVPGFLHMPPNFTAPDPFQVHHRTAAILSPEPAAALSSGIPTLRLDWRYPARSKHCIADVYASMKYLQDLYGLDRFVLVGWSFGGAPVFAVAGAGQRVIGCATVASQTLEAEEGIRKLAPRPVLLLHGTGDRTLSPECSERLYKLYGEKGDRQMEMFDGDNHSLMGNAGTAEEMLCEFIAKCAGVEVDEGLRRDVVETELVDEQEREDLMGRGGDLRGLERRE
ncbi:alpha/beta-hydrolase [Neurospora intermedia]|uniref:Alpha/beta-hydrolase n=1 Tax=Neurospora intermedia TaxID=5142 RepID=A0ABR3DMX8_NEUIN